jgi:hypothetical protein
MHCPKCGTPAAEVQKFCRSCGFGLEKVAQLLEELPAATSENPPSGENLDKLQTRLNRMDQLWQAGLVTLGCGFVTAICWAIISKVMIEKGNLISGGLFLLFFLGIIVMGLSALYLESQKQKLATRKKRLPEMRQSDSALSDSEWVAELNADTTNKLLADPGNSSAASVTEETTARLAEKINAAR